MMPAESDALFHTNEISKLDLLMFSKETRLQPIMPRTKSRCFFFSFYCVELSAEWELLLLCLRQFSCKDECSLPSVKSIQYVKLVHFDLWNILVKWLSKECWSHDVDLFVNIDNIFFSVCLFFCFVFQINRWLHKSELFLPFFSVIFTIYLPSCVCTFLFFSAC